ncbi:unnamed protein product, partial [marine sediment metagenome]
LMELITMAAHKKGYQIQQSELHGLAQRGGAIQAHLRIGKQVYSPLIEPGQVDLIISMDLLEAFNACAYANPKKTQVLSSTEIFWSGSNSPDQKKTLEKITNLVKLVKTVPSDEITEKQTKTKVFANVFLFAYAVKEKFLPFDKKLAWQVVQEKLKGKMLKENKKVFQAAFE